MGPPGRQRWRKTDGGFSLSGGFGPAAGLIPGDLNCGGAVNFGDINPFVLARSDPAEYAHQYPGGDMMNGDANGNGHVDFGDINPVVSQLIGA